jgi:hypothetical protein
MLHRLDATRPSFGEMGLLSNITATLGQGAWKKAIVVLTHANAGKGHQQCQRNRGPARGRGGCGAHTQSKNRFGTSGVSGTGGEGQAQGEGGMRAMWCSHPQTQLRVAQAIGAALPHATTASTT